MTTPGKSQHLEWKESWRDEYLKWVCAFANTGGGVLVVGRNDDGAAVGVQGAAKLLEDLPNKIRNLLGLVVPVQLRQEAGLNLIEIEVEASPYPVTFRGKYYVRSGSTTQELSGAALDAFLLRMQGRHWDGVPLPRVGGADLSAAALSRFRVLAARSGRVAAEWLDEPDGDQRQHGKRVAARAGPGEVEPLDAPAQRRDLLGVGLNLGVGGGRLVGVQARFREQVLVVQQDAALGAERHAVQLARVGGEAQVRGAERLEVRQRPGLRRDVGQLPGGGEGGQVHQVGGHYVGGHSARHRRGELGHELRARNQVQLDLGGVRGVEGLDQRLGEPGVVAADPEVDGDGLRGAGEGEQGGQGEYT